MIKFYNAQLANHQSIYAINHFEMSEIQSKNNFSHLNILVVDENPHSSKILQDALRWLGFRNLVIADRVSNAFERLKINAVDLAMVELNMTEFDGIEFTKIVRNSEDSPNRKLPIILVTSDTRIQRIHQAIKAGAEAVLAKPIRPDVLQYYINHLINNPLEYVQSKSYFGPCRRRNMNPNYDGPERRGSDLDQESKFEI